MWEIIDSIANGVMALVAIVAFGIACKEYRLHKHESLLRKIDVYLERSVSCCQDMMDHAARFWGYAPVFCGNAECAAAQSLSYHRGVDPNKHDLPLKLTDYEHLLQAQKEQEDFARLQTEMEEMRASQRLLAAYLHVVLLLQKDVPKMKKEDIQIKNACKSLIEVSESYVNSVFVAYPEFSNDANRHVTSYLFLPASSVISPEFSNDANRPVIEFYNSHGFSDQEIQQWENWVIEQSRRGSVRLKTLLCCKDEVLNSTSGVDRHTLNLSDFLFHRVEKCFVESLAELTKLIS